MLTQLTEAVDICFIYQKKNPGIKFSYSLPPMEEQHQQTPVMLVEARETKSSHAADTMTTKKRTNAIQPVSSNKNRAILHFFNKQYVPKWGQGLRSGDSRASSKPGWFTDLTNILMLWRKELEDLKLQMPQLRRELQDLKNEVAQLRRDLQANGQSTR